MAGFDAALFAAGGSTSLALAAILWSLSQRRRQSDVQSELEAALRRQSDQSRTAEAAADAFDSVLISVSGETTTLAGGELGVADCASVLNLSSGAS
eukprot:gene14032-16320_t